MKIKNGGNTLKVFVKLAGLTAVAAMIVLIVVTSKTPPEMLPYQATVTVMGYDGSDSQRIGLVTDKGLIYAPNGYDVSLGTRTVWLQRAFGHDQIWLAPPPK